MGIEDSDARQIVAEYISLGADETTISRREETRLRISIYTGVTDADTQTDINLVGIPITAEIVNMTLMIQSAGSPTAWRIVSNQLAATATSAFRLLWIRNASGYRQARISDVGTDVQGTTFRLVVFWLDRI